MNRRFSYYKVYWIACCCLLGLAGCSNNHTLNKRFTLWRGDKIPYGDYYAYENLPYIFPEATVIVDKRSPDRSKAYSLREAKQMLEDTKYSDLKTAYIIIAPQVLPDDNEIDAIFNLIGQGNHVFISALQISQKLLDTLHLKTNFFAGYYNQGDSLTVRIRNPLDETDSAAFTYPGFTFDNYLTDMDSSVTSILGTNDEGQANFVRISYKSGGALYIHLAPAAFTNFFLLHKQNKMYYDKVLSFLPHNTKLVRWDEYFRYHSYGDNNSGKTFSALNWMFQQPPLAWALSLLLLLVALVYLFESKRQQRMIPEIAPLKNASLDFVKTIGRLYYQRRDNKNLAEKMSAHFLDYVRNRYNLSTARLDEEFEQKLAYKSNYSLENIRQITYQMKTLQDMPSVPDEVLLSFNHQLENFYKHS